ncbi:MAG: sodium-translocating pyrophosphatase [Deltaproteobacteria bacterium]|nr:MAG: sodium-translocating pyrophosphatase [Deltaproteobacteria bacterium]
MPGFALIALAFAGFKAVQTAKQDPGTEEMQTIARRIQEGAMAFLKTEYTWLAGFVLIVAVLLGVANSFGGPESDQTPLIAVSFVLGAVASGLAGFIGMRIATLANVRTTFAARKGMTAALAVSFSGGSVMGFTVVGLALLGLGLLYIGYVEGASFLFPSASESVNPLSFALNALTGFSMGASSIALFARVGGGIYTKAADVGADLVGKVESGLPEDDPRNPAVIADNVGDNVGDVAGMGADLFESYVGAIIGTMVLGLGLYLNMDENASIGPIVLPLLIAGAGVITSILGTLAVRTHEDGNPQHALDMGAFGAAGLTALATFGLAWAVWPEEGIKTTIGSATATVQWWGVGVATVIGLAVGVAVGLITAYYCSMGKKPVNSIAMQSKTGHATNIIAGLGVGMESTAAPMLLIAGGVLASYQVAGLYGIAIAALGMLSTTGIQLAVDAFGPIADNAGGIAEMSHQAPEIRERTDRLDAVGNTTAAIGKGFAIASAAMTALALFAAFSQQARLGDSGIDILEPKVMAGVFVGGMLPFLFSSLAMKAVGDAAMEMIEEVRRQFREIEGLLAGTAEPDTARCVDISTRAAIKRMMVPGLLAVLTPVVIGVTFGPQALGGLLAGVTVSGVAMAIFMSNAGGAWDNAKKSFEGGGFKMPDGTVLEKGSEAHDAAVVGDTVGDPFKDTAGPSLNILVKLISVVALVIAPIIAVGGNFTPLWSLLFN